MRVYKTLISLHIEFFQSTEMALLKIENDIAISMDKVLLLDRSF